MVELQKLQVPKDLEWQQLLYSFFAIQNSYKIVLYPLEDFDKPLILFILLYMISQMIRENQQLSEILFNFMLFSLQDSGLR